MNHSAILPREDPESWPRTPDWAIASGREPPEEAAFLSGAALSMLHAVLARAEAPHGLLRARLALRAAEACMSGAGRLERAGELRDAVSLLRPGDLPGPAGAVALQWQRAAEHPLSVPALRRALPAPMAECAATWFDAGRGAPVHQAAVVLETVLTAFPREEAGALIMADAVFARALGWTRLTPLLAAGLAPRDLRGSGEALRLACHRALAASAVEAVRLAHDLARRAARLRAVQPKLRATGAVEAVEMFLSRDAVAPAALTGLMSDRAARRFCDRLVDLGAVRELTGRDIFRLYGL
jgi:hypothetical protein